jgi:hypothetical protein
MHRVFTIRPDLIPRLAAAPHLEDLRTLFLARTHEYKYYSLEVEGGGIDTFGDLFQELEPHQAFALIPAAVDLALEQTDAVQFETALYILGGLARASDTREVPARLARAWGALADREDQLLTGRYRILYYLLEWYRHPSTRKRRLLAELMTQRDALISAATGGESINGLNPYYKSRRDRINSLGAGFGITDPSPFSDLREWHDQSSDKTVEWQESIYGSRHALDPRSHQLELRHA